MLKCTSITAVRGLEFNHRLVHKFSAININKRRGKRTLLERVFSERMNSDISPSPGDVVRRLLKELVPVALLLAAQDGLHTQLLHPLSTGES